MEQRHQRMAQIVRDFMEAASRWRSVADGVHSGALDFAQIERLVGEHEGSVLFRLKEECHALFRTPGDQSAGYIEATELFDLVVGALFHESMKLREGFYLTAIYAPRLERMAEESSGGEPLRKTLEGLLEAGRRRAEESTLEIDDLILETREQLLMVLRELGDTGPVARSLVEDAERTRQVFGLELGALLADVYGDAARGLVLALNSLLDGGQYDAAVEILERAELSSSPEASAARPWAAAMAAYYAGAYERAVELLEGWSADGVPERGRRARTTLLALAVATEERSPELAQRAREVAARLPAQ